MDNSSFCASIFLENVTFMYGEQQSDLSECFEHILEWFPCFILWILTPAWIHMIRRKREPRLKYSLMTISKITIVVFLALIEIVVLIHLISQSKISRTTIHSIAIVTTIIISISYVVSIFFIIYEMKHNLCSSVLLFSFWGLLLVSMSFRFRSNVINFQKIGQFDIWQFILFYVKYALVLIIFIVSNFRERKVELMTNNDSHNSRLKSHPESHSSVMSRITFWWITGLIVKGFRKDLTRDDMWKLNEHETCDYLTKKLERQWNKIANDYMKKVELTLNGNENENMNSKMPNEPSLAMCLVKTFNGKFLAGSFFKLIQDLLTFVGPICLNELIRFTNDTSQPVINGYFLMSVLFFSQIVQTFMLQHYSCRMFIVGTRVKTSLMGLIYRKSIRLSALSRKDTTAGELINLMQINTQTFVELSSYLNMVWSAPLQIALSLVMLWQYLGVACLAGIATIILLIPVNVFLSNRARRFFIQKLKHQDSRLKLLNEILNGIKVLKLYGWEISFAKLVNKWRELELGALLKGGIYNAIMSFSAMSASFLVTTMSFVAFILIDKKNNLDASTAFVSLTLFNIMRFPLTILPQLVTTLIQAQVSLTRIRSFLLKSEIDLEQITHFKEKGSRISLENVDLGWDDKKPILNKLNFHVGNGELVAIVGTVGCGKSSLLAGILGEMRKFNGLLNTHGSIAYVSQQAWIQNMSFRDNILFGKKFDEPFYRQILNACALCVDINLLPSGDSTEIGEKGINLSGGQKQRVSLARALYANADIYLLDDPLSAVDSHIGRHIFQHVLAKQGLLKNKTRLIVTNNLELLHEFDRIIFIEQGSIREIGTFVQLTDRKSSFFKLIQQHIDSNCVFLCKNHPLFGYLHRNLTKRVIDFDSQYLASLDFNKHEKIGEKIVVKEKVETGKVKLNILVEYFKSCSLIYSSMIILFFILMSMTQLAASFYLSDWTKNSNNPKDNKYVRLGIYSAIGSSQYVMLIIVEIFFLKALIHSARYLHFRMLNSILRSTVEFFESTPIGRILNRFSKDIEAIESAIPASYKLLVRCLSQALLIIIIISYSTPLFLIPTLPITIVFVFIQRYYVSSTRQLRRLNSASKSPIFSHFGETLNGISTIRAFQAQNKFILEMNQIIDENLIFCYPDNLSNSWLATQLEIIGSLVTLFACLFAILARGRIEDGQLGLSISQSLTMSQFLSWLVKMSADFESNITSIERLNEYSQTPSEADWVIENTKPPKCWPQNGQIIFDNYSVKYRKDLNFVLTNMNVNIEAGEKIGIVGRSGAGKSSLALSLFRMLESNHGRITIDGIDVKTIGLHDLRHKLTIIPQDPMIFCGTLRLNLDPDRTYSDDQLWSALERAHLKEFVLTLDNKLDFECSEAGENLSLGQKQLICLARALLRKSKVLVLDEATAAVDIITDDLIQQTIRAEFKSSTVLTIAHRLNTIMDSNRIMVLNEGRIVEFDEPSVLLRNQNSIFFSMVHEKQKKDNVALYI